MKTIYLVSLLNRWTGESSPVRAFASKQAATRFIQSAKDRAAEIERLLEGPAQHAAWDTFETAFGCLAIQADELSARSIDFDQSPA